LQINTGLRFWAGIEQTSGEYYFLSMPLDLAAGVASGQVFSGCAQLVNSQYQRLLLVDSVIHP
jgi:hypothetical protein